MSLPVMTGGEDPATWLDAAEEPLLTAIEARQRWLYIFAVAAAAGAGRVIDSTLPQVVADPGGYACKSREMVEALSAWIEQRQTGLDAPQGGPEGIHRRAS